MNSKTSRILLGFAAALALFACADKVVTDTSAEPAGAHEGTTSLATWRWLTVPRLALARMRMGRDTGGCGAEK